MSAHLRRFDRAVDGHVEGGGNLGPFVAVVACIEDQSGAVGVEVGDRVVERSVRPGEFFEAHDNECNPGLHVTVSYVTMGYMNERNPQVSSDVTGEWWEKLFGFDAEQAAITVKSGPHFLAEYVMRGDTGRARHEAQRIALARDALPTRAEMGAISYRERLARALQAPEQQQDGELTR